jgi:hypothetical protein
MLSDTITTRLAGTSPSAAKAIGTYHVHLVTDVLDVLNSSQDFLQPLLEIEARQSTAQGQQPVVEVPSHFAEHETIGAARQASLHRPTYLSSKTLPARLPGLIHRNH